MQFRFNPAARPAAVATMTQHSTPAPGAPARSGPLAGVRVLDLTAVVLGTGKYLEGLKSFQDEEV